MHCWRARKHIFNFIDGILSDRDKVLLEEHLSECRSCESYAADLQASLDLLHRLPSEEPGDTFNWKVRLLLLKERRAIGERMASQGVWLRKLGTRFALSAAAAFVLVFAGGYLLLEERGRAPVPSARIAGTPPAKLVVDKRAAGQARAFTESYLQTHYPETVGSRLVSGGSLSSGSGFLRAIEEDGEPLILDPDSLVLTRLRSMRMRYRIEQLERQIDFLQNYLRHCQGRKE